MLDLFAQDLVCLRQLVDFCHQLVDMELILRNGHRKSVDHRCDAFCWDHDFSNVITNLLRTEILSDLQVMILVRKCVFKTDVIVGWRIC